MALCFDASHLFGAVGTRLTTTFGGEAYTLVGNNGSKASDDDPAKGYCAHWEVDNHRTVWDDYHACVAENSAKQAVLVRTVATGHKGQHVWGRNTGIHGVSFCAMATPTDLPDDPMIQMMGRYIGEHCAWHKVNPRGTLVLPKKKVAGESLVLVPGESISVPTIFDHCLIAKLDGYFPDRWDIGDPKIWGRPSLLLRVQEIADATYDALKSGSQGFQLFAVIK